MSIFDIKGNDLLGLSEDQLEELIFRLAEAEIAAYGYSPAWVDRSGHKNAADRGIDILVKVPASDFNSGFFVKPNTILQSKKESMPRTKILNEMQKDSTRLTLSQQAKIGGSYIIVSVADDCAPPKREERLAAMREAVSDDLNKDKIHLNFFDRSKLVQWLRQHPSVMLWVKNELGQGYSGWQPYGSWSNPPKGVKDTLIMAPGVSVHLPTERGQNVSIEDAIEAMRKLIRSSSKAIRITGLSGVGKTRIVQALFDETVGTSALDRTIAVYVDTSEEPDPSASAMLNRLIAENRSAILVLDNCPSKLHSSLATKMSASSGDVSLITVEYDIIDDKPQMTEVIHIEANGPEVARELLLRRFTSIGEGNARRIAEFADGNARVSLAIAERVQKGESLARLSDEDLLNRLFEQRKGREGSLREQAEVLSLVYSFSVDPDVVPNELEVLGSISGHTEDQLLCSANTLMDRHIVQKRSHWRAILPHAIANKLAESALNKRRGRIAKLCATFEASGRHRLLMSFAHRLGMMHDHPVAREIVEAWLQPNGLLGQISNLDENGYRILEYIGPVVPEILLDRIEEEFTIIGFQGIDSFSYSGKITILNLLQFIAYEPQAFERCIRLMIGVDDHENKDDIHDTIQNKISRFFQPFLFGTHASLRQRLTILDECLDSEKAGRKSLGIKLLSTALDGLIWTGSDLSGFGARPRDYGCQPNSDQLVEWCSVFIDVAVRLATSSDPDIRDQTRQILADKFTKLWKKEVMHEKLVTAAKQINNHRPWIEGWKAVKFTILTYTKLKENGHKVEKLLQENLFDLEKELEPCDLISNIQSYIFNKRCNSILDSNFYHGEKTLKMGEDFATSTHQLSELGPELFASGYMPYRKSFGMGLAKGAHDQRMGWRDLLCCLEQSSGPGENLSVIVGFIDEVASNDHGLSREFLDECAVHPILRQSLVGLHPLKDFSEADLDRCMALLDDEISLQMFKPILWRDDYAHLSSECLIGLAKRILTKPEGSDVLLDALTMKLHGKGNSQDVLGLEFRKLGLQAAIQSLHNKINHIFNHDDNNDIEKSDDSDMNIIINAALSIDGNEIEKELWLNEICSLMHLMPALSIEKSIAITIKFMPNAFFNRILQGDQEQQNGWSFFIRGWINCPPFSEIEIDDLIYNCQKLSKASDWGLIASGFNIWENNMISPFALKFLESSPEPEIVLQTYADDYCKELDCLSGSQISITESKVNAIKNLMGHENINIVKASKIVLENLETKIEQEKLKEQKIENEMEQRFE